MRQDKTAQMIGQTLQRAVPKGDRLPEAPAQYQLQSLLGKQPGRRTFLATSSKTGQSVVVKLLLFGPDFTWEDLKLFEREAQTLASLNHPAIPKYLDAFEAQTLLGEGFVLVQTYIEATSLQAQVLAGRRFSERDLKVLARELLEILDYLHSQFPPVIHRDIKPSNILLGDRSAHSVGKVYLVDFGSVQTVASGGTITVVGTYGYMPPEQFGGRAVPASDLYSLGKTLTYLAIGVHPADVLHAGEDSLGSRRVSFTAAFDQWIERLSLADLSRRTATAKEALQQLHEADRFPAATEASAGLVGLNSASNVDEFALSPTSQDFIVRSTSHEMEIQFPDSRVKGKVRDRRSRSSLLEWAVCIVTPLCLMAYAAAGWGLVLVVAILCCVYTEKKSAKLNKPIQPLSLKLLYSLDKKIFMNLTTAPAENSSLVRAKENFKFSPLELASIAVSFEGVGAQSRIDFRFKEDLGTGRLCIRGKQAEIRRLCEHLTGWQDISIEGYTPQ